MVYDSDGIGIYYTRSSDAGVTWTTPVKLTEYFSRFPFWVVDPRLDVIWLFWKDERDRTSDTDVQADIAAKYSTDYGDSWSALERVTDEGALEVRFPSPALGPNGTVYLTWSDERSGSDENEQVFFSSRTVLY